MAVAVIVALWEFLVMSGMHMVLIVTMMTIIMTEGCEGMVSPAATCATMAAIGFRLKDKKEKSLSMGYFISGILGGGTSNFVNGTISCVIALVVAAVATYFIGFDKNDPAVTGIRNN